MWPMIAQGVMMLMDNVKKKDATNEAAFNSGTVAQEGLIDAWEDNTATNKAIAATNLQNTIRTGYRTGILNVQRGQARRAAVEAGTNLGAQKLAALSSATANAAASGSIGSSVDAVANDIEQQAEQAQASMANDQRITDENYDTQMVEVLQAGQDALLDPQRLNVRRPEAPRVATNTDVIGGALIGIAANYASAYMSLGLGNKTASPKYSGSAGYQQAVKDTGIF